MSDVAMGIGYDVNMPRIPLPGVGVTSCQLVRSAVRFARLNSKALSVAMVFGSIAATQSHRDERHYVRQERVIS